MLLKVNAAHMPAGKPFNIVKNKGSFGGLLHKNGKVTIEKDEAGIRAFRFIKGSLSSVKQVPQTLAWNGAYTVAAWVKAPVVAKEGSCCYRGVTEVPCDWQIHTMPCILTAVLTVPRGTWIIISI